VDWALERGLPIDSFAPRLSFFFNAHNDFFEEIAKYRAARAMWAKLMRDRYDAQDEKSWKLRFHAQTAGCSLTWQEPRNNIVRTATQALAAVLGGCQSLHANSLDEAFALPSEQAAILALRTQQVLAFETGIAREPDPLGGSIFLETLTAQLEAESNDYIRRIDEMGGMIPAIERGFPQSEIANASYAYQRSIERGETVIVGVNKFSGEQAQPVEVLHIGPAAEEQQIERLAGLRRTRNSGHVARALSELRRAAQGSENTMPRILEAVRAYATVGEICGVFREVFGAHNETGTI
jgi:methylmalonyl-CoA mutase N-terminal domain/subunit